MQIKFPGLKKVCNDGSYNHMNCEEFEGIVVCHDCKQTLGRRTEVYSRVCGYLRPVKYWGPGKRAEFEERKTFKVTPSSEEK